MPRYFLEIGYKGTNYSGFQVQENAKTIQSSVEAALYTLYRQEISLTGSSRTDAGVHALQNFFHFDTSIPLQAKQIYNLNAILPGDITAHGFFCVKDDAHCRFDALYRSYQYQLYRQKDPFLADRAWYYPFEVDFNLLQELAESVGNQRNFIAFSKRNTQVNSFDCRIIRSQWRQQGDGFVYEVSGNRFLRGMVRALVSSMLKVARGSRSRGWFNDLFVNGQQSAADFSAPAHGLFLVSVTYPDGLLQLIRE